MPRSGVGVRQLAADLSLSRSAVHRLLQALADLDVARALQSGSYEAGPIMEAWGAFLSHRHRLFNAAQGIMDEIVEKIGESVYLFTCTEPDEFVTVVGSAHCDKPIRYLLEAGTAAPLYSSAAGKSVLGQLSSERIEELDLRGGPEEPEVIRGQLRAELDLTRRRGFATSFAQRIPDAFGIASAFLVDGEPAGSITVVIPSYRTEELQLDSIGSLVAGATQELTRLLNLAEPAVAVGAAPEIPLVRPD